MYILPKIDYVDLSGQTIITSISAQQDNAPIWSSLHAHPIGYEHGFKTYTIRLRTNDYDSPLYEAFMSNKKNNYKVGNNTYLYGAVVTNFESVYPLGQGCEVQLIAQQIQVDQKSPFASQNNPI